MTIYYPDYLPLPIRDNYGLDSTQSSPLLRTQMVSGRARQRRSYLSVPPFARMTWVLSQTEAQLFEKWFSKDLVSGAEWFVMKVLTPLGMQEQDCKFAGMYSGPELFAHRHWKISASIEIRDKPLLDSTWYQYAPQFILYSNLIDVAINREWPEA